LAGATKKHSYHYQKYFGFKFVLLYPKQEVEMLVPNKTVIENVLSTVFLLVIIGLIIFIGAKLLEHNLHERFF